MLLVELMLYEYLDDDDDDDDDEEQHPIYGSNRPLRILFFQRFQFNFLSLILCSVRRRNQQTSTEKQNIKQNRKKMMMGQCC